MKVLFSAAPATGRSCAFLPLARAFAERGHQVAVLSAGVPHPALRQALARVRCTYLNTDPSGRMRVPAASEAAAVRLETCGERSLHLAGDWRPDLVINEPYDFTGVFVARALRRPLATVANGPAAPPEYTDALTRGVAGWFARHRLDPPALVPAGQWLINTRPEALGAWPVPPGVTALTLRPTDDAATVVPSSGRRPRVLVALGAHFGDRSTVHRVLGALTSGRHPELLVRERSLPPHSPLANRVSRAAFRPSADRFPGTATALVHGGSETVLNLLAQGVPLVVLPLGPGQFVEAVLTQRAGCGVALLVPPGRLRDLAPGHLRSVMAEVMGNPWYRSNAERVAAEIAAMPTAARVADQLATAVRGDRVRPTRLRPPGPDPGRAPRKAPPTAETPHAMTAS
ncbi:nucleotide disphospho-sugar-binding domain-containing protein [Kineosporia succinea]|uniref:UDP:flavonoid glycosyltransferase YjiC (YdhE family) n=1 Tax=Kineosporia succinea TaxID=84632 RepID=A0ABT9P5N6_9ACTN|nr:nucleotide disphospho-sugar-binding domain-containing protein [Kineosporia succinea]MDP9827729.1 UDP:flavonoid glycosyltransferase YjiC (YdhE family) [Kineosporia succinea]